MRGGHSRTRGLAPLFVAARCQARAAQLLVEIAVIQETLPVHTDQVAAHHGVEIGGGKVLMQQVHVVVELAFGYQHRTKALDRHVGDGQQLVEHDAEMIEQFALVIGLQRELIRRQRSALRVEHKIQD